MKLWRVEEVLRASETEVRGSRVDCGTCPVSLQCANGVGGNGWKFGCCGSTAVEVATPEDGTILLAVDCRANTFAASDRVGRRDVCPLCSGDVMKDVAVGLTPNLRYVPTVHADVKLKVRLTLWREKEPEAQALARRVEERRAKCRTPR